MTGNEIFLAMLFQSLLGLKLSRKGLKPQHAKQVFFLLSADKEGFP